MQAKDADGNAEAEMGIYDSLNVSSQFLQSVRKGYSTDPCKAPIAPIGLLMMPTIKILPLLVSTGVTGGQVS